MATIENQLRDYIIEKYGSILAFSKACKLPNSTLTSIFNRGINSATISNVLKICDTLFISADELAHGRIVSKFSSGNVYDSESKEITEILANTKRQLLSDRDLMFNGKPADEESIQSILDAMEVGVEIARRKTKNK